MHRLHSLRRIGKALNVTPEIHFKKIKLIEDSVESSRLTEVRFLFFKSLRNSIDVYVCKVRFCLGCSSLSDHLRIIPYWIFQDVSNNRSIFALDYLKNRRSLFSYESPPINMTGQFYS